jgi:hypothetical protein
VVLRRGSAPARTSRSPVGPLPRGFNPDNHVSSAPREEPGNINMIVACLNSQTGGQGYANGIWGRHTSKRKELPNAADTNS